MELRCYRMRSSYRNIGLANLLLGVGLGALASWAVFAGPPNNGVSMPFVFGICSLFALLGLYLVILQSRYRLSLGAHSMRQVGLFTDDEVDLRLVDEVIWRCYPHSVRMSGVFGRFTVDFGNFEAADRWQVIEAVRQSIADNKQQGWQLFQECFAGTPKKRQRSRNVPLWFAIFASLHAALFSLLWLRGWGIQYLIVSGINLLFAAYLWISYQRQK